MRTLTLVFMILSLSIANAADKESQPDVRTLMTPEDFSESGLDKLSDAERAHLSEWVERYREGAVIGPVVHKRPSEMTEEERIEVKKEKEANTVTEIVAKVVPRFSGWIGKTVFRLDNGQVWRQRTSGKLLYDGGDSTVIITRNKLGKYILTHEDSGRGVGVKRID